MEEFYTQTISIGKQESAEEKSYKQALIETVTFWNIFFIIEDTWKIFNSNSKHVLPGNSKHVLPGSSKCVLPGNNKHVLPGNSKHLLPGNSKHLLPGNSKHTLYISRRRC